MKELLPDPKRRSTVDLVVLGITFVIAFVVCITLIGIIVIELVRPDIDTDPLISVESEILGVLVGALVGFVGGRGVGRAEAHNGGASP